MTSGARVISDIAFEADRLAADGLEAGTAPPKRHSTSPRWLVTVLALAAYLVGVCEFMLAPMLSPLAQAFGAPIEHVAWLISGYALSYAVLAPFIGLAGDRLPRKFMLVPALAVFAATALVVPFAPSLTLAIVARVINGIAGAALTPTAFAMASEAVAPHRRSAALGNVLFGLTAGIVTGPTIAGLLTQAAGWRMPFFAVALASALVCALAAVKLRPVTPEPGRPLRASAARLLEWRIVRTLFTKGAWAGAIMAGFLVSGEVLRRRYGLETGTIGAVLAVFGIGVGIGNLAIGRVERLVGTPEAVLAIGLPLVLLTQSAFFLWTMPAWLYVIALAVWGFGCGLAAPANSSVQAGRGGADAGIVLSTSETMNQGALTVLLPLVAGWVAVGAYAGTAALLGLVLAAALLVALLDWSRR